MPILLQCPGCKRKLRVQDHLVGKYIKCPACGFKLQVQAATDAAQGAPAPAPQNPAAAMAQAGAGAAHPPPVPAAPPPLPPDSEEPLEVLDPIVLEEPSTAPHGAAVTAANPPLPESPEKPAPAPELPPAAQGSPAGVFGLLTGLLLATIVLGVLAGFWINRSIDNNRPAKTQPQR